MRCFSRGWSLAGCIRTLSEQLSMHADEYCTVHAAFRIRNNRVAMRPSRSEITLLLQRPESLLFLEE